MVGQTVIWTWTEEDGTGYRGEIESYAATEEEAYVTGYVHWLLMLASHGVGHMPTLIKKKPWRQ